MRIWKNTFLKGIQNDLDYAITPGENFLHAANITLTGDSKFLACENIQGTQELESIISTFSGRVLGVFANKYIISNVEGIECLTIFTSVSNTLKIWAYDIENDTKYELFSETYSNYDASGNNIDAIVYPEQGSDILYFTDNFNEIRLLRCEIPVGYTPAFLSPEQLSLQRRGTIASLNLDSIPTSGGSLLCGSYQFSLRFYNEDSQTYTKWTIPSSPINISQVTTNVGLGSYNAVSSKYIRLKIDTPSNEYALYTHYQFAVIENTQSVNGTNASLLKLEPLQVDSISGGFTTTYHDYKANVRIDFVPITDIVVDLAAISHAKTLQVKNNKLFAGNITYTNLEYDRTPTVSGSVTRVTVDNTDDFQTSTRRGLWRDEVYRYYISYYDSKQNYSRPTVLDLSSIVGNQISNGDLKTPNKKTSSYTLLDGSSNMTNLNLSLTIDSHPTWARGFVILRAKRKARIKFQSPFVPSSLVQGVSVIGNYPTIVRELSGTTDTAEKTITASPMNPVGTHIPKNFFFPVRRDYIQETQDDNAAKRQIGEVIVNDPENVTSSNKVYFLYPPDVYNTGSTAQSYTFVDGDKYEVVDYAFLKGLFTTFQTNVSETDQGNFLDTSVNGVFYARAIGDYYYSNSVTRPDPNLPTKFGKITAFKSIDSIGTNIGSNSVMEYDNLNTTGLFYNTTPAPQRSGVVQLNENKTDSSLYGNSSYGSDQLVSSSGGVVLNTLYEVGETNQTNTFSISKSGGSTFGTNLGILDIVNVVTEQSDDRYGDPEDLHDMVYTGANYAFNETQVGTISSSGSVPITLAVAGGDCYTSLHQFKITDSHYGITNVEKQTGTGLFGFVAACVRWEKVFENKYSSGVLGDNTIMMPVPYRNLSQVVAVVMESEINGEVLAPRIYPISSGTYQSENTNEYNLRTPFTYIYNNNYSAQSIQKAFVPFDPDEIITTRFKARGVYSDQKVYNTFIDGFDVFRASSTFDMEETYGGITKLVLTGDELIAIQERAVAYLPVDAQMAETTDGTVLALRSSTVVDIPRYISRQYGCQHLRGVSQIDSAVFFPDLHNKAVLRMEGQQLDLISETGMVRNFATMMDDEIPEINVIGLFDNKRRQYWLASNQADNTYCWVWDDRLKCWISNYEFTTGSFFGGIYTNNELHLLGKDTDLKVFRMYSGIYSNLMGVTVTPRVQVSINPEFEIAKTFDDLVIYSSAALATADMETSTDSGTNQSVLGMNIAVNPREGNYRIPTLRDSSNGRLRGLRALLTLKWGTSDAKVALNSVVTKYRASQRMI